MPTLASSQVAPPKSWDEFEDIVCSSAKNRWGSANFRRHGRQGQAQQGVDIYGRDKDGRLIGLQCKNTWAGLDAKTIASEVENAEAFDNNLAALYIATTAPTDAKIQAFVRELSSKRVSAHRFEVEVLFWNDIWQDLALDPSQVSLHFPYLRAADAGMREGSHDLRLFEEFQAVFPFEPTVRLLRDHEFGDAFAKKAIQPLYDFLSTWDQPAKEFLDPEIQGSLEELYREANDMANRLMDRTVPIGNGTNLSVLSDHVRDMGGPRPAWVRDDAEVLNKQAGVLVPCYEKFVRLCKAKLLK